MRQFLLSETTPYIFLSMKNFIFQISFLVLFALILPSQVQAQITTCDDPGNPLWVKVREAPVDTDLADDCFMLAYEVYFLANNSSPETSFLASTLILNGQINSFSTNSINNGRAVIREDLTEGPASPGYFNLTNDGKNFAAGFNFLDEFVSVSINSVLDEANNNITPYLTFYVEAPAGTDDIDFVWVTTAARFVDDDFSEFCTFNNSGLANKDVDVPDDCTQGGALSFSPTANTPSSVDLNLNGGNATVLDFSLFIEDVHGNLPIP